MPTADLFIAYTDFDTAQWFDDCTSMPAALEKGDRVIFDTPPDTDIIVGYDPNREDNRYLQLGNIPATAGTQTTDS
ncbi:hypothetical protein [Halorubellus salinus]|uniref:hypothetical protein n=1 Tax=Halorubellus salinus TaxID=755309 RepID=UPI001D08B758|nr:hypothetical protein [Halorubellus salinus]